LPDDAEQGASTDFIVQRHWDGNRSVGGALLQNPMAALLSHCNKAMVLQDAADLFA